MSRCGSGRPQAGWSRPKIGDSTRNATRPGGVVAALVPSACARAGVFLGGACRVASPDGSALATPVLWGRLCQPPAASAPGTGAQCVPVPGSYTLRAQAGSRSPSVALQRLRSPALDTSASTTLSAPQRFSTPGLLPPRRGLGRAAAQASQAGVRATYCPACQLLTHIDRDLPAHRRAVKFLIRRLCQAPDAGGAAPRWRSRVTALSHEPRRAFAPFPPFPFPFPFPFPVPGAGQGWVGSMCL